MAVTTKAGSLLFIAGLLAFADKLHAQIPVGSHYPAGAEGIRGASMPLPGFYLRDYNFYYTASKVDGVAADVDVSEYLQALRPLWMTPLKILGADYGMGMVLPFGYKKVSAPFGSGESFNLADIQLQPLILAWHSERFDWYLGYSLWMPTGQYDASTSIKYATSLGAGFWTQVIDFGGVWYMDAKKSWVLSLVNHYEFNTEQRDTHITPGNTLTMEWGLSKAVLQTAEIVDLGLAGYYQQQTTEDSGTGASDRLANVVGIGPEVNVVWPKIMLFASLR
jgi:hypothetical protein